MRAWAEVSGAGLIDCAPTVGSDETFQVTWDDETYTLPKTMLLTQAINHATEHRSQIMAILTGLGIQPPDLDGWTFALATPSAPPESQSLLCNSKALMATLHLMVGLPCSGKTTLAKRLEHDLPALRLTPDEWQISLFGQDAEEPQHDARHSRIEALLWKIAERALQLGTDVILDFGFWAREEREDYRQRAQQLAADSEIHFLDVSEDELLKRLEARNAQPSQQSFLISPQAMQPWIAFFQKPTPDELERRAYA